MALIDDTKQHMSTALANLDLIEKAHNDEVAALQQQIADLTPKPKKLWGSSIETRGPQAWPDALARVEKAIGPCDITRFFHSPGQGPALPQQLLTPVPRSMVYSFKFPPGQVIAGAADAQFSTMLSQVNKYLNTNPDTRFYWTLEHEGDIRIRNGTYSASDYVKAWDRLFKLVDQAPHDRLLSCNIFTRWCLEPQVKFDAQAAIHPGVDVLGWDPYKQAPNVTVPSMFDPIVAFCKQVGKPWGIAEVGINSRNPNDGKTFHTPAQKAQAATDIATYLKASDAEFICYFNSDPGAVPPAGWGWPLDYPSEVAAANAWRAVRAS